jgi:hypothetical protein
MPYQNITAVLDPSVQEDILRKLNEIEAMLPFLINLTPEERKLIPKMGDKSIAFVDKTFEYGSNNSNIVPPFTDLAELNRDAKLSKDLSPIENKLQQLVEMVSDTRTAAGSEAYISALSIYSSVKNAAKLNVPGTDTIYQDLKQRFPRNLPPDNPS